MPDIRIAAGRARSVLTLVLLAWPAALHAQRIELPPDALVRYERIRVHAPVVAPDRITGRVIEADSTRLILVDRGRTRHALDWSGIRSVEVLDGWERGTSTLVGAVGGALVAGIGFKLIADAKSLYDAENGFFAIAVAAPIGGLVGALIGFASGRPVWQPVRVAPVVRP